MESLVPILYFLAFAVVALFFSGTFGAVTKNAFLGQLVWVILLIAGGNYLLGVKPLTMVVIFALYFAMAAHYNTVRLMKVSRKEPLPEQNTQSNDRMEL